jgi:hypothetical protein
MEECADPQEAVEVLHVALFYSCPRLVHLCELRLASLLRGVGGQGKRGGGGGSASGSKSRSGEQDEEGERALTGGARLHVRILLLFACRVCLPWVVA